MEKQCCQAHLVQEVLAVYTWWRKDVLLDLAFPKKEVLAGGMKTGTSLSYSDHGIAEFKILHGRNGNM